MSFQLSLPASAESQPASELSQEQSRCLVKTFINASLACVCFARGLIHCDSPSYEDRRVDDLGHISLTSTPASYRNFLSFQGPWSANTASQLFKILVGGKDKRADQILNLVENGVFDAVDRGYLEAVQFSLSSNSSQRQDVIECYTFWLTYKTCGDSGHQVCIVKASPAAAAAAAADDFYVAGTQKSFKRAIQKLLLICQQLPALPRHRSLGVNLLYNHTCPFLYEPSGFAGPPDTNTFSFNDPSTVINDVGTFQFGRYEIVVTAGHGKPAPSEAVDCSQVSETINDRDSIWSPTSSHLHDLQIRRQIQAMQRSSSVPSNLIPTQLERALRGTPNDRQHISQAALPAVMPARPGSSKGIYWSSRRKQSVVPTKIAELLVQAWGLEANSQSSAYVLDMDRLQKSNEIKRLTAGKDVNCECGSDHEDDAMTFCELCGLWQHDVCYGLQRYRSQRRPNDHFCYCCLLLPRAQSANDDMPAMVRMRLALTEIYDQGLQVVEKESLKKAVHLAGEDQTMYLDLVAKLEHQGFIRKTSTDGRFVVIREQKKVSDARSNYLDPLARILDYYAPMKDKQTAQDRGKAIQDALDRYTSGRLYGRGEYGPKLDRWLCKDAFGKSIVRWGFYPELDKAPCQLEMRKRAPSPVAGPGVKKRRSGRKMSISKTMVNLDLPSDTCTDIELDDVSTDDNASVP